MNNDGIITSIDDGQGSIVLSNPGHRNAISYDMWLALGEAAAELRRCSEIKTVLIKGSGHSAFSAGSDISEFMSKRMSSASVKAYDQAISTAINNLKRLEVPVIAMVRGHCIGGGLAIALAADIRVASANAMFSIPAARLGLGYESDGIKDIVSVVGPANAYELFFTAGQFDADRAMRMGLINYVVPDSELERDIRELMERISANAPLTIRAAKAAIQGVPHSDDRVEKLIAECFDSHDFREGCQAFMEKREPRFTGG